DASVRRRASDLREKLQEVYATELASSKVRIELPKGKYIPRFVRVEHESATNGAPAPLLPAKSASVEAASREHAHEPVETALSRLSVPAQAASYSIADSVATEPGTSYEAEASGNTFNQMARTWPCDWCSGGARVRSIGRSPRNYLVMNHVNVAHTGNYEMVVF